MAKVPPYDGLFSKEWTLHDIIGREYEPVSKLEIYSDTQPMAGDMPSYYALPSFSKLCGYISPDGKYYECETCQHQEVVVDIANENGYNGEVYDNKPVGMCDEEYFLMRRRSFVKISSFQGLPENMYQFRYGTLTPEQTEILFPR